MAERNYVHDYVIYYSGFEEEGCQTDSVEELHFIQESRAVARKPRDAAAVLFSLKFVDIIH